MERHKSSIPECMHLLNPHDKKLCSRIKIKSIVMIILLTFSCGPGGLASFHTVTSLKVVNMGTAISETKLMDKWAASKRTQVSAILCIKLLPLLENALKLNFKALYETENLDPLQGPTHTLTPSSIHTQNRPQNYGWIYHLLSSLAGYSPKLTATLKNRGLATLGFQKKFHAHQLKPTQAKASFQKVNLPPAKLGMLFHVHLSVTEFWPHIYSLSPAQSSYQTSQIRPNTKMGGACNAERSTL